MRRVLSALLLIGIAGTAHATAPNQITVQGVLRDSTGKLQSMMVAVTVKLFTDQTGTTQVGETFGPNTLTAINGLFAETLSLSGTDLAALAAAPAVWLEVTAGNDVFPRQPMSRRSSSIFATSADSAANLTGVVAIANGGTGSATKSFVDLTTAQSVAGAKRSTSGVAVNGQLTLHWCRRATPSLVSSGPGWFTGDTTPLPLATARGRSLARHPPSGTLRPTTTSANDGAPPGAQCRGRCYGLCWNRDDDPRAYPLDVNGTIRGTNVGPLGRTTEDQYPHPQERRARQSLAAPRRPLHLEEGRQAHCQSASSPRSWRRCTPNWSRRRLMISSQFDYGKLAAVLIEAAKELHAADARQEDRMNDSRPRTASCARGSTDSSERSRTSPKRRVADAIEHNALTTV